MANSQARALPFTHNVVDGIIFHPFTSQKRVDELKILRLKSDDVFIATYAKSGRLTVVHWYCYILYLNPIEAEGGYEP